jgi:hypothetical protein
VLFRWLSYLHLLCLEQPKSQHTARGIIIIILSLVRLSPLGTVASTGLLYQPQIINDGDCGEIGGMKIGRRKPAPAPLCPPQIPHEQTWAQTRATAVGSQRLTLSYGAAMARGIVCVLLRQRITQLQAILYTYLQELYTNTTIFPLIRISK